MSASVSQLEEAFADEWKRQHPEWPPEREYSAIPGRRFRYDFAWPDQQVAVEIQGGQWIRGGHTRGSGVDVDYRKHNLAVKLGWRVLYYGTTDIRKRLGDVVDEVWEVLSDGH